MDIVLITAVVASLFLVIGLAEPLASRLRLPFSVMLAILGIMIAVSANFLLRTPLTNAFNEQAAALLDLPIRANVFLYAFLPTLIFQVTLGVNIRRMLDDWVPILVLAVVAVVVATLVIGYALSLTSALPLTACFLVGAIVSTTDPSAVVGIFRSLSAPRRLSRIIEGESLLNDAAAIALFGLFMGFVMAGVPNPTLQGAFAQFPKLIFGGVLVGWLTARIALSLMTRIEGHEIATVTVSISLPYIAYIVAEQSVGASGVIAVVAAGLTLNFLGPARLTPQLWSNLREVWDILAHWAGALIFILAALLIPRLLSNALPFDLVLVGVVVLAALVARCIVLFGLLPLLTRLRLSPVVERPYRVAILWGGLRGAVTLALALAVTESYLVPAEIKRVVGILATGFTLFTLIVQGTSLRWVISKLGLDKLSPIDSALSNQVVAVALQSVREQMSEASGDYRLTRETARSEAKAFAERVDQAIAEAEASTEILDRDRVTLGLITLAGAERELILERFREGTISTRLSERIMTNADRVIEGARTNGRIGYQRGARRGLRIGPAYRLAQSLHNRLRISGPLGQVTADRFEVLLTQRLILSDLHSFIDNRIRRIHGRRVAELLHELLERRVETVEQTLEGMRLQYPGYAEELERRFIRRTALRLEEREYDVLYDDGLIGSELHHSLRQDIAARRAATNDRPRLDLAVQKVEMVRRLMQFANFDDATLRQLARSLVTRYVAPGTVVMNHENTGRKVFLIASGAVELKTAGVSHRLGRGDMFGQMQILMQMPRGTTATTIAPSTLLELNETRFMRLMKRSAALRDAVRQSAIDRGIDPDLLAKLS